jgi:hypothetical protein
LAERGATGQSSFFPDSNNRFQLPFDIGNSHHLMVEGNTMNHNSSRDLLDSGLIHTQSTSSNRSTSARRSLTSVTTSSGSFLHQFTKLLLISMMQQPM